MRLKARCTVATLFILANSNTHKLGCCGVNAILDYTAIKGIKNKIKKNLQKRKKTDEFLQL